MTALTELEIVPETHPEVQNILWLASFVLHEILFSLPRFLTSMCSRNHAAKVEQWLSVMSPDDVKALASQQQQSQPSQRSTDGAPSDAQATVPSVQATTTVPPAVVPPPPAPSQPAPRVLRRPIAACAFFLLCLFLRDDTHLSPFAATPNVSIPLSSAASVLATIPPRKFHCRLRVLAFWPSEISQFVLHCCWKCMWSAPVQKEATDAHVVCPQCKARARLDFFFQLRLGDDTAAFDVIVCGDDAVIPIHSFPTPVVVLLSHPSSSLTHYFFFVHRNAFLSESLQQTCM